MPLELLKTFANELKGKFDLPGAVAPEDQLKGPVGELISAVGESLGLEVKTRTEAHVAEHKVRPDVAVYTGGLICGYIELKQPGLGANAPKLKGQHNKGQWEKLRNLPNLIYTDGREWALYRGGELVDTLVQFSDDPADSGDAAIDGTAAEAFESLIRDFLFWKPQVPHQPTDLANYLAPLTRFLRSEVEHAMIEDGSAVSFLAEEWRNFFFPEADDAQFADAYAQTVTYALLLARLSGAAKLSPAEAAKTLDEGNGLLARTLELLGQSAAHEELRVGFELLQRSLEALDPAEFLKSKPDLWLYFYEDFLAAYDRKLRNDYGVYYTPREVVGLQVRFATELLEKRFHKPLGFADDGVVFLDPAVGTGTYLVATVGQALEKVRERSGEGAVAGRATQMAENMYGFEILVGPYAVAHLRLKQAIEGVGGVLPSVGQGASKETRLKVFLADTLESPFTTPPGGMDLTHRKLTEEREAARRLKNEGDILVCLGNPPYDRQQIEEGDESTQRKGGWVRFGDRGQGRVGDQEVGEVPIFSDFLAPARDSGAGLHLKNLYNDYVYFWRWALWRMFEQQTCGGIVTFITASSYLAGPGFVGMREVMRRTFDELWIVDLGGDNLGTRKTPNVFSIQTPVAIAVGVRRAQSSPDTPATAHYTKVVAPTREAKLAFLDTVRDVAGLDWQTCSFDWHAPLLPAGKGDFFDWPRVIDLFPYQRSGSKFGRSWPIAETREVLVARWQALLDGDAPQRKILFKNNKYRKIEKEYKSHLTGEKLPSISSVAPGTTAPKISPYAFRAFDRQWAIEDIRFNDRMGEVLWRVQGPRQIYLTTLASESLAEGPGILVSSCVPDLHYFCGRGGKDVLPLYRDAENVEPNVSSGLLLMLSAEYEEEVVAEDVAAYTYALLGGQSYSRRFWNELETPGPRVPITKDAGLFRKAAKLGHRLIWLHTYGERLCPEGESNEIPAGSARCLQAVPSDPQRYPESYDYKPVSQELHVGEGRFGPVSPEVWEFEVSGLKVLRSWLGYRMRVRAGKKSSPLDDIRPDHWTPRMSDELLELLWVLEATLDMEPQLSDVLDRVVAGPCYKAGELPEPSEEERKPPRHPGEVDEQMSFLEEAKTADSD